MTCLLLPNAFPITASSVSPKPTNVAAVRWACALETEKDFLNQVLDLGVRGDLGELAF